MLKGIKKLLKRSKTKADDGPGEENIPQINLYSSLRENLICYQEILENCFDIQYRFFDLGMEPHIQCCIIYINNMIDDSSLEQQVITPLMEKKQIYSQANENLIDMVNHHLIGTVNTNMVAHLEKGLDTILEGDGLLLIDTIPQGWKLNIKLLEKRAIEESASETVIRGPRDAFVEALGVNTTLLRRRLKTPLLKMEKIQLGALTQTDVVITYIEGIVNPGVLQEVKKRIYAIDIDSVLASNYIEEFIQDETWSPFPQINGTERPDKVAAGLLEGQVGVLVDNTPFALLMPMTFPQFLHASEDYYFSFLNASFVRIIRFAALHIALLLPSLYIAVITFHQELLPTDLLLSIAAGRERVPFPALVEALLMETTFEILREAGVRLPRPVGQATSIVGALVIGNAAVSAGLVSPSMVIVVALTALASFVIPTPAGSFSIRLLRFPMMFFGAFLGLFGIMTALMALLIHLCSLRSFGVPYLSPATPLDLRGFKDFFIRAPWWLMVDRPGFVAKGEPQRQNPGQKPQPPPGSRSGKRGSNPNEQ